MKKKKWFGFTIWLTVTKNGMVNGEGYTHFEFLDLRLKRH